MWVMCECDSFDCHKSISLRREEYGAISSRGFCVIVDGCLHGPEPTDILVEERDGYRLYEEGNEVNDGKDADV